MRYSQYDSLCRETPASGGRLALSFWAQANSGAVTIAQDGVANFTNCVFDGNSGSAGGAILAYEGTTLIVDQCTFNANLVRQDQGSSI